MNELKNNSLNADDFIEILKIASDYIINKKIRLHQLESKPKNVMTIDEAIELSNIYKHHYYALIIRKINYDSIEQLLKLLIDKIVYYTNDNSRKLGKLRIHIDTVDENEEFNRSIRII